jgi:hypothetical protein
MSLSFADFLEDYDSQYQNGERLMRQMAIFCHIHFIRGVDEALKRAGGCQPGVRQRMLQLLYADNWEGYTAVIDFISGKSQISLDIHQIPNSFSY